MSGLALAGALSGAGQGLGQGLANMQQGFIQSGLLKERDEMENKRMQLTFEHQEKLQAEKMASDRTMHEESLANAKDINQSNIGMHVTTTGMNNAMHEKLASDTNALSKTLAEMKDNRERLNTEASLEISKNSSYVKIIQSAEDSIDRMRVDQALLEKAAATAAPGDPIFDRIKELDRQLGVAKKEVDLYKGALGKRIGAPEVPTVPKFKLSPELMRPTPGGQESSNAPPATDQSGPGPISGMVDWGTMMADRAKENFKHPENTYLGRMLYGNK